MKFIEEILRLADTYPRVVFGIFTLAVAGISIRVWLRIKFRRKAEEESTAMFDTLQTQMNEYVTKQNDMADELNDRLRTLRIELDNVREELSTAKSRAREAEDRLAISEAQGDRLEKEVQILRKEVARLEDRERQLMLQVSQNENLS